MLNHKIKSCALLLLALAFANYASAAPLSLPDALGTVAQEQSLAEILSSARKAAKREAWAATAAGIQLSGQSDAGYVDAQFSLTFGKQGQYRYTNQGALAQTVCFDGSTASLRQRFGPAITIEQEERDMWNLLQWIHSGFWCESAAEIQLRLQGSETRYIRLEVSFSSSNLVGQLLLDPETFLPARLERTTTGSTDVTTFENYQLVAGIPMAHLVTSAGKGSSSRLVVENGQAASSDPVTPYTLPSGPGADTTFDSQVDAEVELRRVRTGHLIVQPLIEGKNMGWFILDSGAGIMCIDPKVANSLDLPKFGSVPAIGVSGQITANYRQGTHFELGPLQMQDPLYIELDLAFLEAHFGVKIAGICGYEFFARSVLELDLKENQLAIYDPESYTLADGTWSELQVINSIPCLTCRFEGDRSGIFKLDLGDASTISFFTPAVEELNLLEGRKVTPTQTGGVGGSGTASAGTVDWFEVGGHRTNNLPVVFSHTKVGVFSSTYALGNLGSKMLEPFRITFDYRHKRICLQPREL
ncbi:MAG: hypothetical protein ACI8QC_003184 [Planctomycetota bacterium]|jgi:hypothetical protein